METRSLNVRDLEWERSMNTKEQAGIVFGKKQNKTKLFFALIVVVVPWNLHMCQSSYVHKREGCGLVG